MNSAQKNFSKVKVASKNQVVGKYNLPWGGSVNVIAKQNLIATVWNGTKAKAPFK